MKQFHLLSLLLVLAGCNSYKYDYDIVITDTAANLRGLNSIYDDYNSDLPYPAERTDIHFSSNRNGKRGGFDIVAGLMDFSYHKKDDKLNVTIPDNASPWRLSEAVYQKVNTEDNEYGPYTYPTGNDALFMYASGTEGNYTIKFVEILNWQSAPDGQEVSDAITVSGINDIGENLYPSVSTDNMELFFCSNRNDTVFSIYSAKYNSKISKQSLISGGIAKIEKNVVVSSKYDDKCPFVKDDVMVFASNRPGGFGGYDLWYSRVENNSWTEPKNLGGKINSGYDEYRPVVFQVLERDLMVFSSNRPEGKGGFDLYIVKANDLRK